MAKRRIKRKSYNPLKMWGSYIGLISGLFLEEGIDQYLGNLNIFPLTLVVFGILGFFIGWYIHNLFRKFIK